MENKTDSIVEEVRNDLLKRSQIGINKYGVTLDRTDIDLKGWLQHALEETYDKALYLKRAIKELEKEEQKPINSYTEYLQGYNTTNT